MGLPDLHRAAREIFAEALKSVDAGRALRRAVELNGSSLRLLDTDFDLATRRSGIYSIAIGKAALAMAASLDAILGDRLTAGVIAGSPSDNTKELSSHDRWRVFAGGHPLPNEDSLRAAQASFELLQRADDEGALIVFLISGGGSAMIEWPRDEKTTLEELRAANRVLVSCGASIAEINVVRRALSSVKGGGLSARAPRADQVSLIISDTGAGDEANVASGPTFELPPASLNAVAVIARYNLASRLPASILRAVSQQPSSLALETVTPPYALRKHYVLLDNRHAITSAAEAARLRGFKVEFAHDLVEQGVAEGSRQLLTRLLDLRRRTRRSEQRAICLISGGEFACPVMGDGVGGRNAETALRWAIEMDARAASINQNQAGAHTVALSAGTDGLDGNSPAAGAISDETTLKRARALALDAQSFLERSDAHTFFNALGDALMTGPTSTNVRDLRILLAS